MRLVELAAAALSGLRVATIALPHVERLVAETGRSGVLSIWDGQAPIVVVGADCADSLVRISIPHGTRLPLSSASGKIFVAFGEAGSSDGPSLKEAASIRTRRFAADRKFGDNFRTIAAPVFQTGKVVAALALVGTTGRIPFSAGSPLATKLKDAADQMSAELGLNETVG